MKRAKTDLISGGILIVISVVYFILSFQIKQIGLIAISSAFIPRIAAVCTFLLSVAMVVRSVRFLQGHKAEGGEQQSQEQTDKNRLQMKAAIAAFVVLGIGILLMEHVGFVFGMAVYLFLSVLLMSKYEKKSWVIFIILSVAIPVIIYLVFNRGFSLRLPAGIFDIGGGIL